MKVTCEVHPVPGLPMLQGAHELAWSYILDAVFADAYLAMLASLTVYLPADSLLHEVQMRADLTPALSAERGTGIALLAGNHSERDVVPGHPPSDANLTAMRLYRLNFGWPAPAALRATNSAPSHTARPQSVLWVYTWQVLAWGVVINLANRIQRPDYADRALFAMRRTFARARPTLSYYRLDTWTR